MTALRSLTIETCGHDERFVRITLVIKPGFAWPWQQGLLALISVRDFFAGAIEAGDPQSDRPDLGEVPAPLRNIDPALIEGTFVEAVFMEGSMNLVMVIPSFGHDLLNVTFRRLCNIVVEHLAPTHESGEFSP